MNWLHYLLEANLYLGIFYLCYCLFLNRETHYNLGRAYLIFSCIAAFALPLLKMGILHPHQPAKPVVYTAYPASAPVIASNAAKITTPTPTLITQPAFHTNTTSVSEHHFNYQDWLWYTYLAGAGVVLLMLLVKLTSLFRLIANKQVTSDGKHHLICLPDSNAAFSFFSYLFIGDKILETNTIITHELVHIRQKHSADIIFLELLKVINWFNPFIYLLQNSLKTVHEYIADEQTAANETDIISYASFLLHNAYGADSSSITHSFFNYNLLKKRIIMLNQQRSGNLAKLKYLVAMPVCALLLCSSTLVFSKSYGWDLAPAKASVSSKGVHFVKHKRLKVIQNGVVSITDQLAVNQKDTKVIYTAGTITQSDKSVLAKNHHIKVEVVEDSTLVTNADGKPVLPVVNADGYFFLDHFLHKNIHFTPATGDKDGLVEVEFTLDNNRHITDLSVVKSGGPKLDALALNGFNAYKGIVNDDPGKKLKLGVYFFTDDYSIFKTDSLGKDPEFGGELIITDYKYPIAVTGKGYEYDQSSSGFLVNGVPTGRVVIYDKNGEGKWFFQKDCTPADLKMLKDKYGYTFPSGSSMAIQFLHPANVQNKHLAYIYNADSYLATPYAVDFYNQMLDNFTYPEQAKKSQTGGVVVLNFTLDNDRMIKNITVSKSAGKEFDEAAINALQAYKTAINDNTGQHSIAIVYCVAEKQYRPKVSESIKKDGYVGELAISDVKQAFKMAALK